MKNAGYWAISIHENTHELSRGKMTRLYREIRGVPPPKGLRTGLCRGSIMFMRHCSATSVTE
ncbi:hypothetical protein D6N97_22305 [Salmonella enterica]|nr:hypothetical protein [Salmonella enterica]